MYIFRIPSTNRAATSKTSFFNGLESFKVQFTLLLNYQFVSLLFTNSTPVNFHSF